MKHIVENDKIIKINTIEISKDIENIWNKEKTDKFNEDIFNFIDWDHFNSLNEILNLNDIPLEQNQNYHY